MHGAHGAVLSLHLFGDILLVHICLGVVIDHRHHGKHLEIVLVAIDEDVVLYHVVARYGVVVHLLQLLRHAVVVLCVLLHARPHVHDVAAESRGVVETRLAVVQSLPGEHEWQLALLAVLVEHILRRCTFCSAPVVCGVERGRYVRERLYEILVTLHLSVHALHDECVGHSPLVELAVHLRCFMACVSHVEGEVLLLRVEHECHLVASLHELYHLLVLLAVVLCVACHVLLLFVERSLQFGTQHRERGDEILLLEHRPRMHAYEECSHEAEEASEGRWVGHISFFRR